MVEEILPDIFKITVPLPDHAVRSVNSYIIASSDRALVIDTGWNRMACLETLLNAMEETGVDPTRADLFLTHIHADHAGLAGWLAQKGATVYCGQRDIDLMDSFINVSGDKSWPHLQQLAKPHGFSTEELTKGLEAHAGNRYAPERIGPLTAVQDGAALCVGGYELTCVATPGHTPGHMCLYEPRNKFLFAGDHLIGGFTPTISQWALEGKGVADYLASLDKLLALDIRLVLPGHWDSFANWQGRIKKAKLFHEACHADILAILADNAPQTARQIAAARSWNGSKNAWVFFPMARKWSATADTLAHLCYLRDHGRLDMFRQQEQVLWRLKND